MKMIASMLSLDRSAVKALRITDPYSVHRVVYNLFEDVRDQSQKGASLASGILYADQGGDFYARKILILSTRPPVSSVDGCHGSVESKPVPDDFLDSDHYRFKVVINPTRRDNVSRKLVPVRGRDAVAEWFTTRAEKSWGFALSLPHLVVDRISVMRFTDKRQRAVTIGQAEVQGQLTVIDRQKFQESFSKGVGRARAFGCGLLQLVPITDNPSA